MTHDELRKLRTLLIKFEATYGQDLHVKNNIESIKSSIKTVDRTLYRMTYRPRTEPFSRR